MGSFRDMNRCKWSTPAVKLLVSIWSNEQIQKQLQASSRTQPIWESIGRYMVKKGFNVTGRQCRTRIKNMTRLYQEAVVSGDRSQIDSYFDIFHKNIPTRRMAMKAKVASQNSGQIPKHGIDLDSDDLMEENEAETTMGTEESNTVEVPTKEEEPSPYCSVDSTSLEALINRAVTSQISALKQYMTESLRNIEMIMESQRERLEIILAEDERKQRCLEVRLDRLLSRIEATAVPQLTYMGALVAEREAAES